MQIERKVCIVKVYDNTRSLVDTFEVFAGANLWTFLRKRGFFSGHCCTGLGMCGQCAIKIEKNLSNSLSTCTEYEQNKLKFLGMSEDVRLSCLSNVLDNIEIQFL